MGQSSLPARAEPPGQLEAMAAAQRVHQAGSDESLQNSTTSAMRALMELSKQNRSGALSNGYKAYGQYRNSNDLDNLRIKNAISALKMSSAGVVFRTDRPEGIFLLPEFAYDTHYKRLSASFLRKGEAGKVSEEFEKATGMKREKFLSFMVKATDMEPIKPNDPRLVDKVLSRFEGFVQEIPNEEFRKKIEAEIESVPQVLRTGIIGKAISGVATLIADSRATGESASTIRLPASAGPASGALAASGAAAPAKTASPSSASAGSAVSGAAPAGDERYPPTSPTPALVGRAEYRGLEFETLGRDAIGSSLQLAVEENRNDSIFKQVSRKYRSLAPMLSGVHSASHEHKQL